MKRFERRNDQIYVEVYVFLWRSGRRSGRLALTTARELSIIVHTNTGVTKSFLVSMSTCLERSAQDIHVKSLMLATIPRPMSMNVTNRAIPAPQTLHLVSCRTHPLRDSEAVQCP